MRFAELFSLQTPLVSAADTSYMVGKWHLGMKNGDYLPSARGFSKFMGYGSATSRSLRAVHTAAARCRSCMQPAALDSTF